MCVCVSGHACNVGHYDFEFHLDASVDSHSFERTGLLINSFRAFNVIIPKAKATSEHLYRKNYTLFGVIRTEREYLECCLRVLNILSSPKRKRKMHETSAEFEPREGEMNFNIWAFGLIFIVFGVIAILYYLRYVMVQF